MAEPKRFRVYYVGGTTWDDDIDNIPCLHVLGINEIDAKHGRRLVCGTSMYVFRFDAGKWMKIDDLFGLVNYLAAPGREKKVLFGEKVFPDEWNEAMKWMKSDPDFPPRTGWYPDERD